MPRSHTKRGKIMMRKKAARALLGAIAIGVLLAGCGGDNDDAAGQSAAANEADIGFAQQMIPHHEQAVEMAELVPERSSNGEIIQLAEQIEGAQDPEIQTMTGWLKKWGASVDAMEHGNEGHGGMPGMMAEDEMAKLKKAKGGLFDRLWMQMMIKHHQGAIEMAETELEEGSNSDAKALAKDIIEAQQAEIDTMNQLLEKG